MTTYFPAIVAVMYMMTALAHLYKHEYAWATVWACYSIANIGMVIVYRDAS